MASDFYNMMKAASISGSGGGGFAPTQEQLDAMNSGITSAKVSELTADTAALISICDEEPKNLLPLENATGEAGKSVDCECNIEPGNYVVFFKSLSTTHSGTTTCRVSFIDANGSWASQHVQVSPGTNVSMPAVIKTTAKSFRVIPASTVGGTAGTDVVSFTGAMVCRKERWDVSHAYVPYATVNGATTETALSASDTAGIIRNESGSIDYSGSSVYASKMYSLPSGTTKVRVKTTAYDSDDYYMSDYYVYFANGTAVTGQYLSGYPEKTDLNEVLTVPAGSDRVWIVSRKKMSSSDEQEIEYQNACKTIASSGGMADEVTAIAADVAALKKSKTGYVAPNGSDSKDGTTAATAYATVDKALTAGCDRIMLVGGKYTQTIDLSKAAGKHIEFVSVDRTSRPVFYDPDAVLVTSATLNDGVYSATISRTIASGNLWLYQDGVADATTEITDAERMPQQRGKAYRCDDTRIIKCTAATLSAAKAEIKSASVPKWYLDGTTLYFSAPSAPSASYPICVSSGAELFSNADRSISLSVSGIACKYIALNFKQLANVKATDCKASNVFGYGAITYDETINAQFLRCEAASCCNESNGDGFNADVTNSGEAFAKHYTATLIDCWAHDNADDGYSDHRHAETTVIGGLYEYNGKSGITPAYGSHCSCYSVISRKNYSGFACVGEVQQAEGGKYSQMLCVDCIAENNTRGGEESGFYVDGAGNRMILINCKAIGNTTSYKVGSTASARLVDCSTSGQTTIIGGTSANATVETTTAVTD